ncbi:hypothetical protein BMR86_25930, partial [Stenotrophomonas sp. KAs 5-3]
GWPWHCLRTGHRRPARGGAVAAAGPLQRGQPAAAGWPWHCLRTGHRRPARGGAVAAAGPLQRGQPA